MDTGCLVADRLVRSVPDVHKGLPSGWSERPRSPRTWWWLPWARGPARGFCPGHAVTDLGPWVGVRQTRGRGAPLRRQPFVGHRDGVL